MKHLSCEKAGFMSLSCESTGVTDETSKRDIYVAYVWRCRIVSWFGVVVIVAAFVHVYSRFSV